LVAVGDGVEGKGTQAMTVFISVSAHNILHDMSNVCHAAFRCLKLSLNQISEEITVNYKS